MTLFHCLYIFILFKHTRIIFCPPGSHLKMRTSCACPHYIEEMDGIQNISEPNNKYYLFQIRVYSENQLSCSMSNVGQSVSSSVPLSIRPSVDGLCRDGPSESHVIRVQNGFRTERLGWL